MSEVPLERSPPPQHLLTHGEAIWNTTFVFRVLGFGFRASGFEILVLSLRFRNSSCSNFEFRASRFGFGGFKLGVLDAGFQVWGFGPTMILRAVPRCSRKGESEETRPPNPNRRAAQPVVAGEGLREGENLYGTYDVEP